MTFGACFLLALALGVATASFVLLPRQPYWDSRAREMRRPGETLFTVGLIMISFTNGLVAWGLGLVLWALVGNP